MSIDGLENGQLYKFWVVAIDNAGNPSEPKELGTGTPCLEEDFEERYCRQKGQTTCPGCYNCAVSNNQSVWLDLTLLMMVLGIWRWRRKRRDRNNRTGGGAA